MKTTVKIIFMFFLSIPIIGFAQGKPNEGRKDKIEAQKIAYITKQLELTPQEAQLFWPVYNEMTAKKQSLHENFKAEKKKLPLEIDAMTDKDAELLCNLHQKFAQDMLDLRKEYLEKFKKVLPIKKVLKLQEAEKQFRKMLIKQVREPKGGGMHHPQPGID